MGNCTQVVQKVKLSLEGCLPIGSEITDVQVDCNPVDELGAPILNEDGVPVPQLTIVQLDERGNETSFIVDLCPGAISFGAEITALDVSCNPVDNLGNPVVDADGRPIPLLTITQIDGKGDVSTLTANLCPDKFMTVVDNGNNTITGTNVDGVTVTWKNPPASPTITSLDVNCNPVDGLGDPVVDADGRPIPLLTLVFAEEDGTTSTFTANLCTDKFMKVENTANNTITATNVTGTTVVWNSISLGLDGEIPFMNPTDNDFEYEQLLKWDSTTDLLQAEHVTTNLSDPTTEAFGLNAEPNGQIESTLLGAEATSVYQKSTVIGYQATASLWNAIVIGAFASTIEDIDAPGLGTVIIGYAASGPRKSVVIGDESSLGGSLGGVVIGGNATSVSRSVTIGKDSSSASVFNVVIGEGASATNINGTAVGQTTEVALHGTALGADASATKNYDIAVGSASETLLANCAAFGYQAVAGVDFQNELVFGGNTGTVNTAGFEHVHFGEGVIGILGTAPKAVDMRTTDGNGTDIPGADFTISAGRGTGSADGGTLKFASAPAGLTGTVRNPLVDAWQINPDGSFESLIAGQGIILQSPDSTRWNLTIDNTGVLQTALA